MLLRLSRRAPSRASCSRTGAFGRHLGADACPGPKSNDVKNVRLAWCNLIRIKALPIEVDAYAWFIGCHRIPVFNHERSARVRIDVEAVRLEPARVRLSAH